jgi:hypothetical protein
MPAENETLKKLQPQPSGAIPNAAVQALTAPRNETSDANSPVVVVARSRIESTACVDAASEAGPGGVQIL